MFKDIKVTTIGKSDTHINKVFFHNTKVDKLRIWSFLFIQIGEYGNVNGICLFNKYCYTTVFGFEII